MNHLSIKTSDGQKVRLRAPSNWNELDSTDLLTWSRICLQSVPLQTANYLAVAGMYRIPEEILEHLKERHLAQISHTLVFLFKRNCLSKWVIKSFQYQSKRYYGPDDHLANLSIFEYRCTELCYQSYLKNQDRKSLILLAATLYRPKRKGAIQDDIREDLSDYEVSRRVKRFKKLHPELLQAFLLNYEGCRNLLMHQYAEAFSSKNEEDHIGVFDLQHLIESLAGAPFGSFSETEKTNLHRVFRYLVKVVQTNKNSYD